MKLLDEMFCIEGGDENHMTLRLNAAHPIYKAHFPGNPITPGVCIVQMLGELVARREGCRLELAKIVNLKFVNPLSPDATPLLTVVFSAVDEGETAVKAKGTIEAGGQTATKFSLIFGKA